MVNYIEWDDIQSSTNILQSDTIIVAKNKRPHLSNVFDAFGVTKEATKMILGKDDTVSIESSGAFVPGVLADSSVPNNAIYYSSDQSKLAWKSLSGYTQNIQCVHIAEGGDETARLQAILDAASANDTIFLSGAWSVSTDIDIDQVDGVRIIGLGVTITQTGTAKKTFKVNKDRVTIEGIHFVGKGTEDPWADGATDYNGVAGVYVADQDDVTVRNCRFTNHAGGSICYYSSCQYGLIQGNYIEGMGSGTISEDDNGGDGAITGGGAPTDHHGLRILDNYITGHAFGILLPNGDGIVVSNNVIKDIPGQHGLYGTASANLTISGNVFMNTAAHGMKLQNQTASDKYHTVAITGNVFRECGEASGVASGNSGIAIVWASAGEDYYQHNISIVGNSLFDCNQGIFTRGLRRMLISGNRIYRCASYGMRIESSAGSILSNHIEETEQCALYCNTYPDHLRVNGLTVLDCPVNAAEDTSYLGNYTVSVKFTGTPTGDATVYLGDVLIDFPNQGEPTSYDRPVYASSGPTLVVTGPIINETTKFNDLGSNDLRVHGNTVTEKFVVDASGGGVAQTTNLSYILRYAILHDIVCYTETQFDSEGATTFEVGAATNTDRYIDPDDFDPSAAESQTNQATMVSGTNNDVKHPCYIDGDTQIIATWTNEAPATAGEVWVFITYTTF